MLQNISVETLVDHLPCWQIFIVQNTFYVKKKFLFWGMTFLPFPWGNGLLVLRTPCLFSCRVIVEYPWPLSNGNIVQKVCPPTSLSNCQWLLWYILISYIMCQNFGHHICTHKCSNIILQIDSLFMFKTWAIVMIIKHWSLCIRFQMFSLSLSVFMALGGSSFG